jgi:hypothetical protein
MIPLNKTAGVTMKKLFTLLTVLLFCQNANATLWQVDNVSTGSDGGLGFSSLHEANDDSPMTGDKLVDITSASGSYDDVSGALNLVLALSNTDNMTFMGTMLFNNGGINDGFLTSDSSLSYTSLDILAASAFGVANSLGASGTFGFLGGDVCCTGSYDPNSFQAVTNGGGLHYLTLWGADYGGGTFLGNYTDSIVGMDIRLELSEVPVPAAIYLFASSLLGLAAWRRRSLVATRG